MRAMALAEVGDWSELERFSKSKKLPVGMQVKWEVSSSGDITGGRSVSEFFRLS